MRAAADTDSHDASHSFATTKPIMADTSYDDTRTRHHGKAAQPPVVTGSTTSPRVADHGPDAAAKLSAPNAGLVKDSSDYDSAMEMGKAMKNYDSERLDRVYLRIDRRIIPPFWFLYFICSAIRANVGIAQTMNRKQGHDLATLLHLSPRDVSTALALFYASYVVFDMPSNLAMTKFGPRVWMVRIVFASSAIGTCFTAASNAWSLKLLRFLLGMVSAGLWPGMAFYLTLFYPPARIAKRIGFYFTASQVSAAVVGLISAACQAMDGLGGLAGFRWMFLIYGLIGLVLSLTLLWWLPDRPLPPGTAVHEKKGLHKWLPDTPVVLKGQDALIHYQELKRVYQARPWTLKDLKHVLLDWRLWPLTLMYFGVVGVGIGTQLYGSVIIGAIRPDASSIEISLLFAPIWIMDLIAILIVTPISDRFHNYRGYLFSASACIVITGVVVVTFARDWARYVGLLVVGFGLGPTVPICMAWTSQIFQPRHGEIGVAVATALVSGLGNLGSVLTTYALYAGWPDDASVQYFYSNMVMIAILSSSIISALIMMLLLKMFDNPTDSKDGIARRDRK